MNSKTNIHLVDSTISYMTLRKIIGWFGIIFPFLLVVGLLFLGGTDLPGSISASYYTGMRNVFVSLLTATAMSFFFYRSDRKVFNLLLKIAALCALGVAFFPTLDGSSAHDNSLSQLIGKIHLGFAASLFLIQGIICFFFFPKIEAKTMVIRAKEKRNFVYKGSGLIVFLSLIAMAVYIFLLEEKFPFLKFYHPIFMLESIGLQAAGLAWLIKGEVIFK